MVHDNNFDYNTKTKQGYTRDSANCQIFPVLNIILSGYETVMSDISLGRANSRHFEIKTQNHYCSCFDIFVFSFNNLSIIWMYIYITTLYGIIFQTYIYLCRHLSFLCNDRIQERIFMTENQQKCQILERDHLILIMIWGFLWHALILHFA